MRSKIVAEINQLSATEYLFILGLLILALVFLFYTAFKAFRRFRFVDGTATSKIRSAAQGLVELKGLAEFMPGDLQVSPFSERRCLWFHCTIEKQRKSGKHNHWVNVSDELSDSLFHLQDDTGTCVINPDHAHVIPEVDRSWYGRSMEARFQAPKQTQRINFGGKYRFRERLITPATELYALGEFKSFHPNPSEESVNARVEDKIRDWKLQPQRYLRDFDLDQNNKIDQQEWERVRAAAGKEILQQITKEQQVQHLLGKPQNSREPYILSAVEEQSLVARKKLKAYASLAGVLIAFSLLVWCLSIRTPVW